MARKKVAREPAAADIASIADVAGIEFGAALTEKQVDDMEQGAQSENHGIARRIGLTVASRTKAELCGKMNAETFDTLDEISKVLASYVTHLESVLEVMKAAQLRTMCAMATIAEGAKA